jgi:hypothetical protein
VNQDRRDPGKRNTVMDLPLVAEGVHSTLSHTDDGDRGRANPRLGGPLLRKAHVSAAPSRSRTASTGAAVGTGGIPHAR